MNVVAPGPVAHLGLLEQAVEMCDHGPAWGGRTNITPQDVAEGIAFLCSDSADYLTGNEMRYLFK